MKITIYELLGLVKDGKAPKKIKYDGTIYEYSENDDFYYWEGLSLYREFTTNGNCLDKEVEIIEESKKIEKINRNRYPGTDIDPLDDILDKLDELIDEINNLKEND